MMPRSVLACRRRAIAALHVGRARVERGVRGSGKMRDCRPVTVDAETALPLVDPLAAMAARFNQRRRCRQRHWHFAVTVWMLALMTACQAQPASPKSGPVSAAAPASPPGTARPAAGPATDPAAGPATEAALLARINREIGQALCTADAQCRSLAIGHKPCGGPESWLAWSTSTGSAGALKAWSDELTELQRQRQRASGMVSTCQANPDPGALCQAGRCVLRTGSAAR